MDLERTNRWGRIARYLGGALTSVALGCSGGQGPSASTAGSADGGITAGEGPQYIVVPGSDLPPPPVGDGYQIVTPDYSANNVNAAKLVVPAGAEIFLCYYITLPNTEEFDVGAFQSWMSPGSSHHFILYQQPPANAPSMFGPPAAPQPDGTVQTCAVGTGTWVYATSTPGAVVTSTMPAGVGLPFPAGQQLVLNMHFINPGSTPLYPKVRLNIVRAKQVNYRASVIASFNRSIDIPGATASGPGTQTVGGTCTIPAGSKVYSMSTHTHKHAIAASVHFITGGVSSEIVHTGTTQTYPPMQQRGTGTDWEHPGVSLWQGPEFLTFAAGDSFSYSCSYVNMATNQVTVGETASNNEMCMMVGYFFPAGPFSCQDTASSN
jgi:hypothetical protein